MKFQIQVGQYYFNTWYSNTVYLGVEYSTNNRALFIVSSGNRHLIGRKVVPRKLNKDIWRNFYPVSFEEAWKRMESNTKE